jgi:hypothetical protein
VEQRTIRPRIADQRRDTPPPMARMLNQPETLTIGLLTQPSSLTTVHDPIRQGTEAVQLRLLVRGSSGPVRPSR